jgi:hypothetical protein
MRVTRVHALVTLRPRGEREAIREYWRQRRDSFTGPDWLLDETDESNHIELTVSLSADDPSGRRIDGDGSFGIAGPRKGISTIGYRYHGPPLPDDPEEEEEVLRNRRAGPADIEDAINQMLGRDPAQQRPPRLAWGGLIAALGRDGIQVSEEELINAPLTVVLDSEVEAELAK